jgi:hypothetical protein
MTTPSGKPEAPLKRSYLRITSLIIVAAQGKQQY